MTTLQILCQFFFVLICSTASSKVKLRYNGRVPLQAPCRRILLSMPHVPTGQAFQQMHANHYTYGLNCTDFFTKSPTKGYPDEHGNYTGLIGYMQRNEADYVLGLFRLDSFSTEPVLIGPVGAPADVSIVSVPEKTLSVRLDISSILQSFDFLAYAFIAIILNVVTIVLSFACVVGRKKKVKKKLKRFLKRYLTTLWNTFELIVDQENENFRRWPEKILWFFLNVVLFIVIFGYLCNLMSTDQVAEVKPDQIDGLEDQLSERFKHVRPTVLKNLLIYEILKKSRPTTTLGQYFKLLLANENETIVEISFEDTVEAQELLAKQFNDLLAGKISMTLVDYLIKNLMTPIGCQLKPDLFSVLHISKKGFGESALNTMFNKLADAQLNKFLKVRAQTFYELGLTDILLRNHATYAAIENVEMSVDVLQCKSSYTKPKEPGDPLLRIESLLGLFHLVFVSLAASLAILSLELFSVTTCSIRLYYPRNKK